jgi:F-type H+-transporting ATPase subunit b
MLIDNFTVIAQLINFLILVWLLKRFLYQPVLRAIDARERRLQEQQRQAQDEQAQAQELKQKLEDEQRKLQQQRDSLLEQARTEARELRETELEKARSEIEAQKEQWRDQVRAEQQQVHTHLRDCVLQEMHTAIRRALHDLADQGLEQQMVRHFIALIEHLASEQRAQLERISANSETDPLLKTSFPVDENTRKDLSSALSDKLGLKNVNFRHDTTMTCGIKLEWDDYHLEWNLDAYLEQMKQKLQRQLEEIGTEGRGQEQNQHQNQSQKNRSSAQQETSA